MEHYIIGKLVDVPILNIEKPWNNNEMCRTADGKEFSDALYSAHDDALEGRHYIFSGRKLKPTSTVSSFIAVGMRGNGSAARMARIIDSS